MEKESKENEKLYEERLNNQGCLMRIVEYIDSSNIVIEFQDKYKARITSQYSHFKRGQVKNPYYNSVFGVGMIGVKYPISINGKHTKEYNTWKGLLERCFDEKYKKKRPTYKNVTCCDEWLLFENFYEWLHSQENFEKWLNSDRWAIDKDILVKGNNIYSSETCCLVPINVNSLFTKHNATRGNLPIGVIENWKKFRSYCTNPFTNKIEHLGTFNTSKDAFYLGYKPYKEDLIKQVAEEEYNKGNITQKCYDAMMNYEVEITD